jgi:hypothetical protein
MGTANGMHSFDSALYQTTFADLTNPSNVPANLSTITGGWGELGDVISINGVPMERTVTQLTHLRSPDKAQEKVPGFLDAGQNTIRLNYYKALMTALMNISPGGPLAPDTSPSWGRLRWAVVLPDHGVWVFIGFIKSTPIEVPEDNRNTIEVTIEISGKPKWLAFA